MRATAAASKVATTFCQHKAAGSQIAEGEQPLILTLADSKRVLAPPMRPLGSRFKVTVLVGVYLTAGVNQTLTRPIDITNMRSKS